MAKKAGSNKMDNFQIPTIPNMTIPMMTATQQKEVEDCTVDQHFSKAELQKMSQYEKKRYQNLKRNYLMLLSLGLPVSKPEFMQGPSARKRKFKAPVVESDSDEEWTPTLQSKKNRKDKKTTVPIENLANMFRNKKSKENGCQPKKTGRLSKMKPKQVCEPSSYPKRNRPLTNYMNLEIPDDDNFLYCDECNKEYEGDCPDHGALHIVEDSADVPVERLVSKAISSLPVGLSVRTSNILGAGQGVFATQLIPARSRFGPYTGEIIRDIDQAHSSGYSWQIYRDGKPSHFVDASNAELSNWMRFVNCARTESEQNLTAFQYKGEVYYRSHVDINAGQELLVWYGSEYGTELGIHRQRWRKSRNGPYTTIGKLSEILYSCGQCPEIQFLSERFLRSHMKYKHHELLPSDWNSLVSNNNSLKMENRALKANCGTDLETKSCDINQEKQNSLIDTCINDHSCSVKDDHKKHVRTHTGEKPFKCTWCDYRCSLKDHLTKHVTTHTGEKPFKCTWCDYRCSVKSDLTRHVRSHTGEKPFKCTWCDYRFNVKSHLTDHVRTHTGEKPFKCTWCDYRCSLKDHLTTHVRTHTGEKPFKCTWCDYRCSLKDHLTKHVRTHTGEKPFKCTWCDFRCSRKGPLTDHVRTHTGEKPFKCTWCDYRCSRKGPLTDHVRTHTGEKPFKCTWCDYRCSQKSHLTKHVRTHTGEKPFKCTWCDYRCSQKTDLTRHVRTHTGEKPFKCTWCDYRCSLKGPLTDHVRTHTGEKPFKCTWCDYRCSRKGHLTVHVRTHTGEKPFKCTWCDYRCSLKDHLTRHVRTHTGEKPFKCTWCDYKCSVKTSLNTHIKTCVHNRDGSHTSGNVQGGLQYQEIHTKSFCEE